MDVRTYTYSEHTTAYTICDIVKKKLLVNILGGIAYIQESSAIYRIDSCPIYVLEKMVSSLVVPVKTRFLN